MIDNYKIGIIGTGSIGSRHLHNIVHVLNARQKEYTIDLIRSGKGKAIDSEIANHINKIYAIYDFIPDDYDILFVTNPTHLHYETMKQFAPKTKHMFIEKPVFDSTNVNLACIKFIENNVYYVACPLRYTEVIQYLKSISKNLNIFSVRAICSSYLPDWRPNQDYRVSYSAHKDQGGGVSIDLIHEWDYITYLFGQPNHIVNIRGHFSKLDIDSDDLSIFIASYPSMAVELHLDYFGRKTMREITLITDKDTIIGDIANSVIRYLNSAEIVSFKENRNDCYQKEMEHFFDIVEGKAMNDNSIITALRTLRITKEAKIV